MLIILDLSGRIVIKS